MKTGKNILQSSYHSAMFTSLSYLVCDDNAMKWNKGIC